MSVHGFGHPQPVSGQPVATQPEVPSPLPATQPGAEQPAAGNQANPQEQQIYDKFTAMALMHIYDPKSMEMITQQFAEAENPRQVIGQVAANVGMAVMQKAAQAGDQIPGDVILNAGQEIVSALVEIYEGVPGNEKVSEDDANGAFYWAADTFREMAAGSGMIDEQTLAADMDQIGRMEQDGTLEQMMAALQQERQGEGF